MRFSVPFCDIAVSDYRNKVDNSELCETFHTIMPFLQCGSAHPFTLPRAFSGITIMASLSRIIAKSHGKSRSGA